MIRFRGAFMIAAACAWLLAPAAALQAQEQFQFVIAASDAEGNPVSDLTPEDVLMSEKGMPNKIVKVEPLRRPVKLTLAVDNGPTSQEALSHYRSGLAALVEALPEDVEVSVITTAPQPRRVVQPTANREQILRGINQFGPQTEAPRFTDTLVEFSKRFEDDYNEKNVMDSIPVLVMISTTAPEVSSYEVPQVSKALTFLRARRAQIHVAMITIRGDVQAFSQINDSRQALIALPATESTGGHYEALAISNRLATLLPEWGQEIAALHLKYNNQWLVTVERATGLTPGQLQEPQIGLARDGLNGEVSLDGMPTPPELEQ
jgi:hypothetical protein